MGKRITKIGRYRVEDGTRLYNPEEELTLRELAGYQRRAVRTVLHSVRGVEPEVLRFARKAIRLTQAELASILGVAAETVSRWETGEDRPKMHVQLALAYLLDCVENGVGIDTDTAREYGDGGKTITLKAG
jgi:DNA-binding transcriptional regulator YiaG